jgi:hypothetical protein
MHVVRIVFVKYDEVDVCPFGSASIRANLFAGQETVNVTFVELTILFSLACRS